MTKEDGIFQEKKVDRAGFISIIGHFIQDKPLGAAGGIVVFIMILVAILAPLIAPKDPLTIEPLARLSPPSWQHLLGTDQMGRDVLSRVIYGTRISALVGLTTTLAGSISGAIIGIISGYLGRRVDMILQRLMDILMAFPMLILVIAIMAMLGASVINLIFAIAVPVVPRVNRVVRSVAVSVKEYQYIEAAQAIGAGPTRIIFRHVLPNCIASYLIVVTSLLGGIILAEASLSFLGLGIPAPAPSWGRSLSDAMPYYITAPWMAIFPGLAISLAVFGANLFGDALRDTWDPRMKKL
ncbi:ABC transporter permease [Chloroflexota bacterium]